MDFFKDAIPSLTRESSKTSLVHQLDPRIKILASLFLSFTIVALKSFAVIALSWLWVICFLVIAKVPLEVIIRRLKPVVAFGILLILLMTLTAPVKENTVYCVFFGITLNLDGFYQALRIFSKAFSIVLITAFLLETSTYTTMLQAMQSLKVPSSFTQMLMVSYRYIFVIKDEAYRMNRAMKLRGLDSKFRLENLKVIGNFLGILFVRSFERIQRIYDAMVLRGYRGSFPNLTVFRPSLKDWLMFFAWLLFSIFLFIADNVRIFYA